MQSHRNRYWGLFYPLFEFSFFFGNSPIKCPTTKLNSTALQGCLWVMLFVLDCQRISYRLVLLHVCARARVHRHTLMHVCVHLWSHPAQTALSGLSPQLCMLSLSLQLQHKSRKFKVYHWSANARWRMRVFYAAMSILHRRKPKCSKRDGIACC